MTVLKYISPYEICSEKLDECYPEWGRMSFVSGIALVLMWIVIVLPQSLIRNFEGDILIPLNIVSVVLPIFLMAIPNMFCKCGIRIYVKKYQGFGIPTTYYNDIYQFTEDKEKDAMKIKEIVFLFEQKVNLLVESEKSKLDENAKKRELCCNQYKSVMDLVKE